MSIPININQCNSTSSCDGDVILLVQGDTNPSLVISLINEHCSTYSSNNYLEPIDVFTANVVLTLSSNNNVFATVVGTKVSGLVLEDGTINFDPPYDELGRGGRVAFEWKENDLSQIGYCQGEVTIYFENGSKQTVYNLLPIKIRPRL